MKEITDAFGNWFAGFVDGEGCFLISRDNRQNPKSSYRCQFKIALRNDDRRVLELIRENLGFGKIYARPAYLTRNRNEHAQAIFWVCPTGDCVKLAALFEKYPLRAKKQRDFGIWKLAVTEVQKPVVYRNTDLLEYYFLKIKEVRQYDEQEETEIPILKKLQLTLEFE